MEAFPSDFVVHNLPLIVLSGLATTKEVDPPPPVHHVLPGQTVTHINSEIAAVEGERAKELLNEFLRSDATNAPWNARSLSRKGVTYGFRMRSIGRVRVPAYTHGEGAMG